jgi:pyruvate,orthophosphate dikinase
MLGHRGCRLGVSYPEIYEMQVRAIIEAACDIAKSGQGRPGSRDHAPARRQGRGDEVPARTDRPHSQKGARRAGRRAQLPGRHHDRTAARRPARRPTWPNAEFFSFGTNDLTQTTFGISRDDAGKFLGAYIDKGIFEKDPFVTLDQEGVGDLVRIAVERGRAQRPGVKLGICGEHGGDPASIDFCEKVGLDYVSAARPTACRSPAWRRPRPPWASAKRTGRELSAPSREGVNPS